MAANKEKLLESAQKNLKKKQVARAIKDFAKVVEIDPSDVRSRQKLAELLVKSARNAEAYEHYEVVAKYFATNGFYLKAIAIYKQMLRLDPSQISLFGRLAELNEKQGLIGNAMAEYRNLIGYYERNGMVADVIKVLEKMRNLDESNLNVRVKLAEVYTHCDRVEEGLAEFEAVLAVLRDKNDFDKILKLYQMFMPLFPENRKMKMGLGVILYEKGELQNGITILEGLLQDKPDDPDLLRLIACGYADLKEWPNAGYTYQRLLALDPTDLEIREDYIQCQIGSGEFEQALDELEEWKETFFKADRLGQLKLHYETLKEKLPESSAVLQTLDSIYELTGEGEKMLNIMSETDAEETESAQEETLSDSILASAEEDIEIPSDIEVEADEEELLVELPEEDHDLQLDALLEPESAEPEVNPSEEESAIRLDLKEDEELAPAEDELELSFDLDDEGIDEPSGTAFDIAAKLEEAEFYIQQGLYTEAEKLCSEVLTNVPDSEECQQKLNVILKHLAHEEDAVIEQDLSVEFLSEDAGEEEDEFFSALDDESEDKKIFRTDVDEQIAADDMESHYNLGIAYREMGLLDDAISEFTKAEKDPSRYVDCQTLKGLCFSDRSDFANAELMYQQALDSPHLEAEQRLSLGFELASLYEKSERLEEALSSYRVVMSQDESYRNVKEKIATLQGLLGIEAEEITNKERVSFL
ncbi:tetratricopeptide repeat protein [Malonomonas rubra]|uniref:tetratricopeptide repeat protein n=1 Tax=Malonomonas rubra TaxID=57040 RepID=UPI0026EDF98B|nr:tetratricopeptide repeat protein [Malonomonas rubra]